MKQEFNDTPQTSPSPSRGGPGRGHLLLGRAGNGSLSPFKGSAGVKSFLMAITFLLGFALAGNAQNAPITTCATATGAIPGPVDVPITVTGFTAIGAVSLTLDYDYSVVHFIQGTPNPLLGSFLSGDMDLGNGFHRISMGWYGSSATLPNGSTIMTLNFTYIGGNAPLTWFDNGSSCEYADPMGNSLNDLPTTAYYLNGYICGGTGNPGTITGNNSVCQGQAGVSYGIAPMANVAGYTWTVPAGAAIISGQNTNSILVDYSGTAVSGNVTVFAFNPCGNGPSSQLSVAVNQLPIANAGNDTTINYGTSTTLHAAPGGTGSFSYHWSPEALLVNPNVQNPQTVILISTTIFTLVVTNLAASGCHTSDDVIVSITGGPLSLNPIAVPGDICKGEYSQLYSNAGGGSGSYTYLWTCVPPGTPPWSSTLANPLVSPESTRLYQLSLHDGFTTVTGSVNLPVFQLPTATISGGDTLCGTGSVTTLRVDLTGAPPWSFLYTNGINSVTVYNQYTTPYYIITGDAGTYTIHDLQDLNCTGTTSGSASVSVFAVPATPSLTIIDYTLISSVCCGNQWYQDNAPIPGATGQSVTATVTGSYYDIVTLNGCSSDTSETVGLIVGLNESIAGKFSLSPNPAHDLVNVIYNGRSGQSIDVRLTSVFGQLNGIYHFKSSPEKNIFSIDISRITPGLYIVTFSAEEGVTAGKLVVN